MDPRILVAVVVGLVLVAFGGFYFALRPHSDEVPLPAPRRRRRLRPPTPGPRRAASAAAPLLTHRHLRRRRWPHRRASKPRLRSRSMPSFGPAEEELQRRIRRDDRGRGPAAQRRRVGSDRSAQELNERFQDDHARQIEIRRRRSSRRSTSSPPTRRACFMPLAPRARDLPQDAGPGRHPGHRAAARKRAAINATRHALPLPGYRRRHAERKAGGRSARKKCGCSRHRSRAKASISRT